MNSATAACLRAAMCASSRSHAQITPATSSSEAELQTKPEKQAWLTAGSAASVGFTLR